MLKPNNMNPTWDIVLKANSLFILDCVKPTTVHIINDKRELIIGLCGAKIKLMAKNKNR